jgi:hypothetical protein
MRFLCQASVWASISITLTVTSCVGRRWIPASSKKSASSRGNDIPSSVALFLSSCAAALTASGKFRSSQITLRQTRSATKHMDFFFDGCCTAALPAPDGVQLDELGRTLHQQKTRPTSKATVSP